MTSPKVSVIIPVYKTEKYIKECVESVLNQDYPNIEIILVDDGSPDNCPAICDSYAARDRRIKTVHKLNSGSGLTRNAGVEASSGEYVTFVDSDDKLDGTHAISYLVEAAETTEADVVVGCFRRFNEKSISAVNNHHLIQGEDVSSVNFRFKGFYQYGHLAYDWGKLYKVSFMVDNDLKRGAYPFTQDKAFNMCFYSCNPKYTFLNESVYCYRVNEDSVTFKYKTDFVPVWVSIASDYVKFLDDRCIMDDIGDLPAFHIFFGAFFYVKQELNKAKLDKKKHAVWFVARKLKEYDNVSFVHDSIRKILKQKYIRGIRTLSWRLVIRLGVILFKMRLYRIFVRMVYWVGKMEIDTKVSKKRYQE